MTAACYRAPALGVFLLLAMLVSGVQAQEAAWQRAAMPAADGPLAIRLVYPSQADRVDVEDSSFVFGSVGDGRAAVTVNGQPARVTRNGAFIAWIRYPAESPARLVIEARRGSERATTVVTVQRTERFDPPATGPWIDPQSLSPRGRVWWPAEEALPLSVRASEGATVSLVLPGGRRILLSPTGSPAPVPAGLRAFDRDTARLRRPGRGDRYAGAVRGLAIGSLGPVLGAERATPTPVRPLRLEAVRGRDTVRVDWPLAVALLDSMPAAVRLDDSGASAASRDGITTGRAHPGATYHWFFPAGTLAQLSGRINDDLRIRLGSATEAWVPLAEALAQPAAVVAARARVDAVTVTSLPDRVSIRIPIDYRVPYRIEEESRRLTLRLYGASGNPAWIRHGPGDTLVTATDWRQVGSEVELSFQLDAPLIGYRARWDRNDLLLEIRRPRAVNRARPLAGRLIVVDPGHPPGGSTGPTGLREAEATLAVALLLEPMLTDAGARVIMTRRGAGAVGLIDRVRLADSVDADLMLSIHGNALPDGVPPEPNHGSSVFYFHPRSADLARRIQARLVEELGTRDLGIARGDLAVVRPTWMPAVLAEGLFMMWPEHEAWLRSEEGRRRYARALKAGLEDYFRHRSAD